MKQSIRDKLENLVGRLDELDRILASGEATRDMDQYRKLTREHSELGPVVALYKTWQQTEADRLSALEMMADPEMKDLADEEMKAAKERLPELESELQRVLLPKDANDDRNVFLEIRAGTGGDESALFVGNLFRMYTRFAERQRWQVEVVSSSESEVGGYKEVIARIVGTGVYSKLKFESGGHRVQRVPETEAQGRIHTSACTVAVMAEADELEAVHINPSEIRIDTFRASGAGGQHINKTDSAVRIVHLPTGIVVECQDGRSQHKNKAQALSVLVARIKDAQEREQHAKIASERKSLVGSGDRSERIRTYNFPQGRVTDHRINLTLYKIDSIMVAISMNWWVPYLPSIRPNNWQPCRERNNRMNALRAIGELWHDASQRIDRLDARLLLEYVGGWSHRELIAHPDRTLSASQQDLFTSLLSRREAGEPLAYLLGSAFFYGLEFNVSPAVLIPRSDTEVLVNQAKARAEKLDAPRIVDLGTGSGVVAILLARLCPSASVTAVDISVEALEVAQSNAVRLGASVRFLLGDWFAPLHDERFDLIVSNPPYVAEDDPHLRLNGLPFEPRLALTDGVAGSAGLACIEMLIAGAGKHLFSGGSLLIEHGYDQAVQVREWLKVAGFCGVESWRDEAGIERVSGGYWSCLVAP